MSHQFDDIIAYACGFFARVAEASVYTHTHTHLCIALRDGQVHLGANWTRTFFEVLYSILCRLTSVCLIDLIAYAVKASRARVWQTADRTRGMTTSAQSMSPPFIAHGAARSLGQKIEPQHPKLVPGLRSLKRQPPNLLHQSHSAHHRRQTLWDRP